CNTPGCTITKLLRNKDGSSHLVLYPLSDGACATYANHLSCHEYKACYYPNYVVQDGVCSYYEQIPDPIQVGEHQYVERTIL
ncbi:hypothetical protein C8R46DRAFT_830529, partial [Mycena filopes]